MAQTVTVSGEVFNLPTSGDVDFGAAMSRWMRAISSAVALPAVGVSPSTYGVVGDGVRDDSSEMQDAVDAAIESGSPLILDEKTYLVKNLVIDGALTVLGKGRGKSILKLGTLALNTSGNIFSATSITGIALRDLTLDGNKAAHVSQSIADTWAGRSNRAALKFSACTDVELERCEIKNTWGAGLACLNTSRVKAEDNYCHDNNLEPIYIYTDGTRHSRHRVCNNVILNTGSGDATIHGNAIILSRADDFVVSGNIIDTVERNAIKTENCKRGQIIGNSFANSSTYSTTPDSHPTIQLQLGSEDISVIGNTCYAGATGIAVNQKTAGEVIQNIVIANNTISNVRTGNTPDGILCSLEFDGASNISIVNNVIRNQPRFAISVAGKAISRLFIEGNQSVSTGINTGGGIRLAVTTDWNQVHIKNNVIDHGTVTGTSDHGMLRMTRAASSVITNALIESNTFKVSGGQVCVTDLGVNFITGTFRNNTATTGVFQFEQTGCVVEGNVYMSGNSTDTKLTNQFRTALTTPVTIAAFERMVFVKLTSPGAVAVSLPATPQTGHVITIKDATGDAGANNITITPSSGNIDGAGTKVMSTNYQTVRLVYSGTQWLTL